MTFVVEDRIRDSTTTTGTGTITVSGTAPTRYRTFSAVLSVNDTFPYAIVHQSAAEWEVGVGTYSAANQFTRTTIYSSSLGEGGTAVTFSAGTKDVFIVAPMVATAAQYLANTLGLSLVDTAVWAAAATIPTLTETTNAVTPDMSAGIDFIWTIANSTGKTVNNPTNVKVGQKGIIYIAITATGANITSFGTNYKFPGTSKPTALTNSASALDLISYAVKSATEIECFYSANMS